MNIKQWEGIKTSLSLWILKIAYIICNKIEIKGFRWKCQSLRGSLNGSGGESHERFIKNSASLA